MIPLIEKLRGLIARTTGPSRQERELDDELRFDLERREADFVHQGLSPEDAARRARQELGGVVQVREACRESRPGSQIESLLQDVRFGARMLRKNPLFAGVALLTLAIGIGANTAIFSVVNQLLLQPLPFPGAERLVILWTDFPDAGIARYPASPPQYLELKQQTQTLEDLAAIWASNGALAGDDEPMQLRVGFVTTNFFDVINAPPRLGRTFDATEQGPGGSRAMMISDELWRRRFGADPEVIGRSVRFNGRATTVVGVMAPGHALPFPSDAKVPARFDAWVPFPEELATQPADLFYFRLVGRLKPDVSLAQAQSDVDAIAGRLAQSHEAFADPAVAMTALPLKSDSLSEYRRALLALVGAVGVVMLLACTNVANLLLARASDRRQEYAMRAALGASLGRLVRQMLCESLLLFGLAGVAGTLLAHYGVALLWAIRPDGLSAYSSVPISVEVFAFTFGLSLACGLIFGLSPVLEIRRVNLSDGLRGGVQVVRRAAGARFRQLLIVSEVAVGLVLLIVSALFINSLVRLAGSDPGFMPERTLTFRIAMPRVLYPDNTNRAAAAEAFEHAIAATPGVSAVGAISHLPLDDEPAWISPYLTQENADDASAAETADHRAILPGYFRAIGASMVAGRPFDDRDRADSAPVTIIDDALAEHLWPGDSAVGRTLQVVYYDNGAFVSRWADVVGVVRHIKHYELQEAASPQVYLPYAQCPRPQLSFVVRGDTDAGPDLAAIRAQVATVDRRLALSKVRSMEAYVDGALTSSRFTTLLLGIFSATALTLALIGLYGVLAYQVRQRTREFGILLALGASPGRLWRSVIGRGMGLIVVGLLLGVPLAFGVSQFIGGMLFEVSPSDPVTYGIIVALFLVVALLACLLPARRAMRVDPLVALRSE